MERYEALVKQVSSRTQEDSRKHADLVQESCMSRQQLEVRGVEAKAMQRRISSQEASLAELREDESRLVFENSKLKDSVSQLKQQACTLKSRCVELERQLRIEHLRRIPSSK